MHTNRRFTTNAHRVFIRHEVKTLFSLLHDLPKKSRNNRNNRISALLRAPKKKGYVLVSGKDCVLRVFLVIIIRNSACYKVLKKLPHHKLTITIIPAPRSFFLL